MNMRFWLERAENLRAADQRRRAQLPDLQDTAGNRLDCWKCRNYVLRPTGPGMEDQFECPIVTCPANCPPCTECSGCTLCDDIDPVEAKEAFHRAWEEIKRLAAE